MQTEAIYDIYYNRDGGVQSILAQNHLNSFNRFLDDLPHIFASQKFNPYKFVVAPAEKYTSVYKRFEFELSLLNPRLRSPLVSATAMAVPVDYRKDLSAVQSVKVPFTPRRAINEDDTYGKNLFVDAHCVFRAIQVDGDVKTHQTMDETNIDLGLLPIMLMSKECLLHNATPQMLIRLGEDRTECGGYVVVMGMRKIIVAQEDHISNGVFVYNHTKTKRLQSEIWCRREGDFMIDTRIEISHGKDGVINVNVKKAFNKKDIPFPIIFRAIGVLTDKDIIDYILCYIVETKIRNAVSGIIFKSLTSAVDVSDKYGTMHSIRTKNEALIFIYDQVFQSGRRPEGISDQEKITDMKIFLREYLFPQCVTAKEKAYALGYAINRLLLALKGYIGTDDRDSFRVKTVKFAGRLCEDLMFEVLDTLFEKVQATAAKKINASSSVSSFLASRPLKELIKPDFVGKAFQSCISTGDWTLKKSQYAQKAVTQRFDPSNYSAPRGFLHMMKVATKNASAAHRAFGKHLYHQTLRQYVDPVDTPDGKDTGLIKRHTILCETTLSFKASEITALPEFAAPPAGLVLSVKDSVPALVVGMTRVYVNHILRGFTSDATRLRKAIIEHRRNHAFSQPTVTVYDDNANDNLHVCTYDSRLVIPLVIVDPGNKPRLTGEIMDMIVRKKISWAELFKRAILEYISIDEGLNCKTAYSILDVIKSTDPISYTHCLVHPSAMLGILMHTVPFPGSTQAPRNVFSCQYVKYTHGVPCDGVHESFDYNIYSAYYVQSPCVLSRVSHLTGYSERPNGQMVTIAFMCMDGFNKEDAVIISRSATERGMLASIFHRLYKDTADDSADEFFAYAGKAIAETQTPRFSEINANSGVPNRGAKMTNGKVIISKFGVDDSRGSMKYIDHSIEHREPTDSIVDASMAVAKKFRSTGSPLKVRISEDRKVGVGDKFSPRHAQKGVCGELMNIENMPFAEDGMVPDILLNSHAYPSRMIVSQPKEIYESAIAEKTGINFIETPNSNDDIDIEATMYKRLKDEGFQELMTYLYNPYTGRKIKSRIFRGPCFYQRLPQIVLDKMHKRAEGGPITAVMRQPTAGRGNEGGLRLGEMERDALIAAGGARILNELSMVGSDKYTAYFCEKCGSMSWTVVNPQKSLFMCKYCENSTIHRIEIPYVTKLTSQLMTASCVNMCIVQEQTGLPYHMND